MLIPSMIARGLRCVFFLVALGSCHGQEARALPRTAPESRLEAGNRSYSSPLPADSPLWWRSPQVRWCSSGGAPIVGQPVLDEGGRAYVATSDGYLHSFEPDGRYRWSYTVKGTPLGSVSLRPSDGVILMGTTSRYVYAIHPSGSLHWSFRTVSPVWSGLFALNPSTVVFLGLDERLYALSNTGAALYRVRAPGTPTVDPVVARSDVVWVGMGDGVARFVAAYRLEKYPLPSAVEQVVALGDDAMARAGGRAYLLRPGEDPQDMGPADFLVPRPTGWAIVLGNRMRLLGDGSESLQLPVSPSAPPAVHEQRVWIPDASGQLSLIELTAPEHPVVTRMQVARQPLRTPVLGPEGRRALVATQNGEFCAIELP